MPFVLPLSILVLQGPSSKSQPEPPPPTSVAATRAAVPPVLDGKDDDAVWQQAPRITQFRVFRPTDGAIPKFQTEVRVAYDSHNLYVFVRAFDPHPDSVVALLARRDVMTPSDVVSIFVDSYHDRRTGYEFDVNPVGVKVDAAIFQDGNEDMAWDGVWDVATQIDSLGWTAEFRIPLSQLRYAVGNTTFGFTVARQVERTGEATSWPPYHTSQPGLASQLGELMGLDSLAAPRRTELLPYVVTKNVSVPTATGFDRGQRLTGGADFKVGIASNLTLTGTVNPDFGQVEADPAVLNLTAFESFFPEKRPFFVEGNGLFQFNVNCSAVNCSSEELFYSRRIGRAPQLASGGDLAAPSATTIIGAGKLTGRLPSGLAIGVIDAVTQHETGAGGLTVEPTTNYAVVRATQDFHNGGSGIGVMFTGVDRSLDSISSPYLHRTAYVGAFDLRHRFLNDQYEVSTSVDLSRVAGSAAAIRGTQLDPVHFYQRPDGPLHVDSMATSLAGDAEEIHLGKIGGNLHFETSYLRRSPGFEINDLGFLLQADQQSWNTWMGLFFRKPNRIYRQAQWNFNWWQWWSAAGLPTERAANTNVHLQLPNLWWLHLGGTLGQLGTTYCDRNCTRGGPAVRQNSYIAPWFGFNGDDRKRIIPNLFVNYFAGDAGHNEQLSLQPQVTINASSRVSVSLGANVVTAHADNQWYGNFDTLGTHYTLRISTSAR